MSIPRSPVLVVAVALATIPLSQPNARFESAIQAKQLPHARPVIDGAQRPDLMPDDDALLYFFNAAKLRPKSGGRARSRAYLSYLQIVPPAHASSQAQERVATTLIEFATSVSEEMAKVDRDLRNAVSAGDTIRAHQLRALRRERLRLILQELGGAAGSDAVRRVDAAVQSHIKRHMKLVYN